MLAIATCHHGNMLRVQGEIELFCLLVSVSCSSLCLSTGREGRQEHLKGKKGKNKYVRFCRQNKVNLVICWPAFPDRMCARPCLLLLVTDQ